MFYLFMGFAAVWVLVLLYLLFLSFRQRSLESEMRTIREEVAADAASKKK